MTPEQLLALGEPYQAPQPPLGPAIPLAVQIERALEHNRRLEALGRSVPYPPRAIHPALYRELRARLLNPLPRPSSRKATRRARRLRRLMAL
jgi:hypothetical protein